MLRVKKTPQKVIRVFSSVAAKAAASSKTVEAPAITDRQKALNSLVGKSVFFMSDGERVAGKATAVKGDELQVTLAVPSRDGLLILTENELCVKADDLEVVKALVSEKRVAHFEAGAEISIATDKKTVPIFDRIPGSDKPGDIIVDYRDVVIDGFASTFVSTTAADRGGDYILPGAFDKTIAEFMKNPVILADHANKVNTLVGSWEKVGTNQRGLAVRGNISNAPGLTDLRFKLVERHLKGLSIGGIWWYAEDGRGIEEADLFEISLVPVPMNPDALAFTRSLGVADCQKAFSRFWRSNTRLRDST